MNREIKFRAWDKADKVMREVYGLLYPKISNHGNRDKFMVNMHCSDYEGSKAIILSDFERPLDEVELMQFTGLLDKNGKEIYEGDIIETRVSGKSGSAIKAVIWNTKYCGFNIKDDEELEREIIGNIYENPELLTN